MKVNKKAFKEFLRKYPRKLYPYNINFATPSSTIYCDFELHPEMKPGLERIQACTVAEHIYPNEYIKDSKGKYYIIN